MRTMMVPQTAEEMVAALKASIEREQAKRGALSLPAALALANGVASAERLCGKSELDAKLAALDALIAQVSR
jgi:hypothetical protein